MKTKRYGWALQHKLTKKFARNYYGEPSGSDYDVLEHAWVGSSREDARLWKREEASYNNNCETVVKVALTKNGKPYKVIGRG